MINGHKQKAGKRRANTCCAIAAVKDKTPESRKIGASPSKFSFANEPK
jgi:hypothetical protein